MIKAIVVDLDGVYYKKGGMLNFVNFLKSKNIEEKLIEEVFFTGKERNLAHLGKLNLEDFVTFSLNKLGGKVSREELIANYTIGLEIDWDLKNYLQQLRNEQNITIGICSNTGELATLSRKINNLQIEIPADADFAVYSYEVGFKKPDKKIFEIVVEKAKCSPGEIIYADDSPSTMPEASLMGIHTYVYEEFAQFKKFTKSFIS